MADLYSHDGHKFADAGLQLRVPVDLVPSNMYSRLTNALPIIEGRLESRAALSWIVFGQAPLTSPGSGLHSLTRLNVPGITAPSERVAGLDTTVQAFTLPSGAFSATKDIRRSGDPLSLPTFHFNADPAAWQIIADWVGMRKYKNGIYNVLGILPPMATFVANGFLGGAATAAAGAAGNLNNGAGPGYDWVYTFVNTATQSESNPSAVNWGGANFEGISPVTLTVPDPSFGGAPGTGVAPSLTVNGNSAAELRQSGLLSAFPAATQEYQALYLQIGGTINITNGSTGGAAYTAIYMSLDGGITWKLLLDTNAVTIFASNTYPPLIYQLPVNQDLTLVQIRAVALGVGNISVPQNVTVRRVRGRGGNFSIADLLTGGGGNATITTAITPKFFGVFLTATPTLLALANQQAIVTLRNPFDAQVDAVRLYRRGGSVTASWAFVNQYPVTAHDGSAFNVTDNVADANLGNFVSLTNDAPVTSIYMLQRTLPYVWGPGFNPSRLFGCGDPDRPDAIYYSNPGNADQWGVGQWVDVSSPSDPMQNGCVFNTRVFAFSKERMFELQPAVLGGATLTPFQTPCSRGLISPWGLTSTARAIYFVAKDGIYTTLGGEEQSLVENNIKPLFPTFDQPLGQSVEGYDPVDMERIEDIRLRFHNDELYFIYRGRTESQLNMLVYDQNKNRWRAASYPVHISTVYSEEAGPASSLLLGDSTGSMYSTQVGTGDVLQASTSDIPVTIRTGAFDQSMPLNLKEYGNVLFDLDPGGATIGSPVTITPLLNGEVITAAAITVTGTGRQQVPLTLSDVFGFNIEFQITFVRNSTINPILYQFDILWRSEPASVKHWEARETSHGLPGWQHLRDMNIALRSSATVTLTLTFDGAVTQTYSLASTAGLRQKVYVPLHANKFKLVRYSLDSAAEFRIYESDLEVRAKPWVTDLGYAIMKPFGGESSQAPEVLASELLGGK